MIFSELYSAYYNTVKVTGPENVVDHVKKRLGKQIRCELR